MLGLSTQRSQLGVLAMESMESGRPTLRPQGPAPWRTWLAGLHGLAQVRSRLVVHV